MTSCKDITRPTPEPAFERHPTLLLSVSGSCRETEADVSTEGIQSRETDTEASQGPRVQGRCCRVAQTPGRVAGPSSSQSRWAVLGVLEEMVTGTTRCSRGQPLTTSERGRWALASQCPSLRTSLSCSKQCPRALRDQGWTWG